MKTNIFLRTAISIFIAYMTIPTLLVAQAGSLDASFGINGIVTTEIGYTDDIANDMLLQPDGKIIVAGTSYNNVDADFALTRYNPDGSLDLSFSGDGKVTTSIGSANDEASAVALQADGKIIAVGYSFVGTQNEIVLVRYNVDGSLDTSFDQDAVVISPIGNSTPSSIAIQTDGKIVISGSSFNGVNYDFLIFRLNPNGSIDSSFDGDGIVTTDFGNLNNYSTSLVIQTDGKIVAAGSDYISFTYHKVLLARYNTDGSLDTSFDNDGKLTTTVSSFGEVATSIGLQIDGKILVSGRALTSTEGDFMLIRYNTDGSLDNTFDGDGIVITPVGNSVDTGISLAVQSNGKIVVGGSSVDSQYIDDFSLASFNTDGSLNTSFDLDGKVITPVSSDNDLGRSVAIQSDGKIIMAGYASNGTDYDFALARYNVTPTGITETKNEPTSLCLFPNPFSTSANIQFNATINHGELCIYNISGEKVKTINNIQGQSMIINREHLEKGHYIIKLTEQHKLLAQGVIEIVD